jgi:glutathione S-transferase
MTIQLSAFLWVPPFAQGYVKDLRVRWALEEAGFPYEAVLIGQTIAKSADYCRWQPFGQVPAYRDDEVELFESGAILLHLAARSEALAPTDAAGRARVASWVIAALNSIEPHAQNFIQFENDGSGGAWAEAFRSKLETKLCERLAGLSAWLGDKDYFEDRFTAADLMMAMVLRELVECGMLARFANLDAHRLRCEARPAFGRALEAQMQAYRENAPT